MVVIQAYACSASFTCLQLAQWNIGLRHVAPALPAAFVKQGLQMRYQFNSDNLPSRQV
jgi:hypothetical protein